METLTHAKTLKSTCRTMWPTWADTTIVALALVTGAAKGAEQANELATKPALAQASQQSMPLTFDEFLPKLSCVKKIEKSDFADTMQPTLQRLYVDGFTWTAKPLCRIVRITGEIATGDAKNLDDFIRANLPFLNVLELNSPGGNLSEALEIGRIARKFYLTTEAPSDESGPSPFWVLADNSPSTTGVICASACFFAWLGGVNRVGNIIGIHRPFPSDDEMRKMSPVQANRLYQSLSEKIANYLSEMDAAPHWLPDMLKTPSNDLYFISKPQIAQELTGEASAVVEPPGFAQWKISQCGGLTETERKDLMDLAKKVLFLHSGSEQAKRRFELLEARFEQIAHCGMSATILARWQLRIP